MLFTVIISKLGKLKKYIRTYSGGSIVLKSTSDKKTTYKKPIFEEQPFLDIGYFCKQILMNFHFEFKYSIHQKS